MTLDEQDEMADVALEQRGIELRNRLAARVDLLERRGQQAMDTAVRVAQGAKALWPVALAAAATVGVGIWAYRRFKRPRAFARTSQGSPVLQVAGMLANGMLRNLALGVVRGLAQRALVTWVEGRAASSPSADSVCIAGNPGAAPARQLGEGGIAPSSS